MTKDEFINWETDNGSVRIGDLDASFVLVKRRGDDDGAIALRQDYEAFRESYAHAFADRGVFRHFTQIADISTISVQPELNSTEETE